MRIHSPILICKRLIHRGISHSPVYQMGSHHIRTSFCITLLKSDVSTSLDQSSAYKICKRFASAQRKTESKAELAKSSGTAGQVTVGKKVVQASKDATYSVIVIAGIAITGGLFYFILRELFSGQSPSGVYSRAVKKCLNCDEVLDVLGHPVKAYGETTRRGRRRHTSHTEYEVEGVKHMRMKFYIEGSVENGTVQLEVQQDERGKYEFRYLFVTTEGYPSRTIIVEDNR